MQDHDAPRNTPHPDRGHIRLWRRVTRQVSSVKDLREWRDRILTARRHVQDDDMLTRTARDDSIVIFSAMLAAIREEIEDRYQGKEK